MSGFIRPGGVGDALRGEDGPTAQWNPRASQPLQLQRQGLPIARHRRGFLWLAETKRVVLVCGEAGCGKTTQLPQYLAEAGWTEGGHCVVCTQPRRLAAQQAARRVAQERGVQLGTSVGYSVRFAEQCSREAEIKYVTDGVLLREMCADPLLSRYSAVIVDEAHVRSLHSDLLLGLLKRLLPQRPALRLIVASAALDIEELRKFFAQSDPGILSVGGTNYPVDCFYLQEPCRDYIDAAVACIASLHRSRPRGDVLVFLPTQEECDTLCALLREGRADPRGRQQPALRLCAFPLHGGLSAQDQLRALRPPEPGQRKVVAATNLAETGITIPGVVYVIDSGFARVRVCDPLSGVERHVTAPVSAAEALQRTGRAGRVCTGTCFRLYTEAAFEALAPHPLPEVRRAALAPLVLQLKAVGVGNVVSFDYVTPPSAAAVQRAAELLFSLGALDAEADLTEPLGAALARLPCDPRLSVFLLTGHALGVGPECEKVAAMMSVEGLWARGRAAAQRQEEARRKFFVAEGDALSLLNIFTAFEEAGGGGALDEGGGGSWAADHGLSHRALSRAAEVRRQLQRQLQRQGLLGIELDVSRLTSIPLTEDNEDRERCELVTLACIAAWFANAAFRAGDGSYVTVRGRRRMQVHHQSALHENRPAWLVFGECVETDALLMRDCVAVSNPMWLVQAAPHFYDYARDPHKRRKDARVKRKRAEAAGGGGDDELSRRLRERQRRSNWLDIGPL